MIAAGSKTPGWSPTTGVRGVVIDEDMFVLEAVHVLTDGVIGAWADQRAVTQLVARLSGAATKPVFACRGASRRGLVTQAHIISGLFLRETVRKDETPNRDHRYIERTMVRLTKKGRVEHFAERARFFREPA